jgi:hypothetical protein
MFASTGASDWEKKLAVGPLEACLMLDVSMAHLYKHILTDPDVQSYKEGRLTKIVVASLKRRQARKVAERQGRRPRGRPKKAQARPVEASA